jgi:16S rRNA (adenine1518-N6/adenine1519-N6)-dimethyltransferase
VLQIDWSTLFPAEVRAKAIGNLPYSITSPLLEKFIEHRQRFERAVWTLQLEVAQKVTAPPGTRASSSLGVFVQAFCETKLLFRVSKRSFWPPPEVDSAVVQLFPLEKPRFKAPEEAFLRIVRAAFGLRRKTLLRALTLSPHVKLSTEQARAILRQASIAESRRGETLTLEEFDRLAQELAQMENSA